MVAVAVAIAATPVATILEEVDVLERLWSPILGWKAFLHGEVDVAGRLKWPGGWWQRRWAFWWWGGAVGTAARLPWLAGAAIAATNALPRV